MKLRFRQHAAFQHARLVAWPERLLRTISATCNAQIVLLCPSFVMLASAGADESRLLFTCSVL
jgi:hypothetical protein